MSQKNIYIGIQVNDRIQIQMEEDSAGQVGVSLEFDFDFEDHEINLMESPNTKMPSNHEDPPVHEVQINETAENISTVCQTKRYQYILIFLFKLIKLA